MESQLLEIRTQSVAKGIKNKNEKKTSIPGHGGAARRRWLVVRRVDLAHACVA
jgi:hypothetical protein